MKSANPGRVLTRSDNASEPRRLPLPAGDRWEDKSLGEWPENDYRIFVGDLGAEVNDDMLTRAGGGCTSRIQL